MHPRELDALRSDERALRDLADNPRPMTFEEAAALLILSDDQMLALDLPAERAVHRRIRREPRTGSDRGTVGQRDRPP